MEEKEELVRKFQELVDHIEFEIPNETSSQYYLDAIRKMILEGAETKFDIKRVTVIDREGKIQNGIREISLFFGEKVRKIGLLFHIKTRRPNDRLEMNNRLEVCSVKAGILSEREELTLIYGEKQYRYDYLREYEIDGTCIYHSSKDMVNKTFTSAKLYDKGLLISQLNIETNSRRSIVLLGDYTGEKRKITGIEIKRGKIFESINSPEGKEVPYQPYPFTNTEFEKILLKI